MAYQLCSYRTTAGVKTVLVDDRGRKYLHVLIMNGTLTVRKVPKEEGRYMRPVIQSKRTRALSSTVRQLRSYGKRYGMTKEAKNFLRRASKAASDQAFVAS